MRAFTPSPSPRAPRFLLLDDDPAALAYLAYRITSAFPRSAITTSCSPRSDAPFEVAIVDNDFGGSSLAADVVRELRARAPDALLLVYSATLDRATLKELIGAGASGAYDKSDARDLDSALAVIGRHLGKRGDSTPRAPRKSAVVAIADLIREWNARLDSEESRLES